MEVDAADAVNAHGFHHLRDIGGRDWDAGALLPILARVSVVRYYRSDVSSSGAADGRSTQQELHQIVIDWRARGLYDVDVGVTHVLEHLRTANEAAEAKATLPCVRARSGGSDQGQYGRAGRAWGGASSRLGQAGRPRRAC